MKNAWIKPAIAFLIAVAISLLGATYRWGDSSHAIGLISSKPGIRPAHAASFKGNGESFMLVATATVIPPYKGEARVELEGDPKMPYEIELSHPVIDLRLREWPTLNNGVISGLRPKQRIALWVSMKPPVSDPVCGMANREGFLRHKHQGRDYYFCAEGCRDQFIKEPDKYIGHDAPHGSYALAFYDAKTDSPLMRVPITFNAQSAGNGSGGGEHEHH